MTSSGTAAGQGLQRDLWHCDFRAGVTSQLINIRSSVTRRTRSDETFTVTLSAPSSGATIADRTGTGTIVDNDAVSAPGGPAVPFGSHLNPYAAGTILPMGSQATIDAAVVSLYNKWRSISLSPQAVYSLAVKSTDADYRMAGRRDMDWN